MDSTSAPITLSVDLTAKKRIKSGRQRKNEAVLHIEPDAFTEECMSGLLDDWIVPLVVEEFLKNQFKV